MLLKTRHLFAVLPVDRFHVIKSKTKKPPKILSSLGITDGKFISFHNFTARCVPNEAICVYGKIYNYLLIFDFFRS